MPMAGSVSPTWSNADADDFWDDDLGALDDDLDLAGTSDHVAGDAKTSPQKNGLDIIKKDAKVDDIDGSTEDSKIEEVTKSNGQVEEPDGSVESKHKVPDSPGGTHGTVDTQGEYTENCVDKEIQQIPRVGFPVKVAPVLPSKSGDFESEDSKHGDPETDIPDKTNIDSNITGEDIIEKDSTETEITENEITENEITEKDITEKDSIEKNHPESNQGVLSDAFANGYSHADFPKPETPITESEIEPLQDHKYQEEVQKDIKLEVEPPVTSTSLSHSEGTDIHQSNGSHKNDVDSKISLPPSNAEIVKTLDTDEPKASKKPQDSEGSESEDSSLAAQIKQLKLELAQKDEMLSQLNQGNIQSSEATVTDPATSEKLKLLEQTLQKTEQERDHAQEQLEGFLSKISSMKTVFQNFKATQNELEEVRGELAQVSEEKEQAINHASVLSKQITELEASRADSSKDKELHTAEIKKHQSVIESLKSEALDLNSECDRLSQLLGTLRREFSAKEETLQDEKYALENEVSRLNKKLSEQRNSHGELELEKEEALAENKNLVLEVDELKERLSDKESELEKQTALGVDSKAVFESQINELQRAIDGKNDVIKSTQAKVQSLENEVVLFQQESQKKTEEIEKLTEENEKIKALEEDVQNKQLAIGKLRHEAIILNEHLTKSISMLKQKSGDSDQTVDRELVSNLILNFLQIPRGDTKKFEALSLIGGLLDWDDQKKIQAGLMHSGKNDENKPQRSGLISLWTDFLDKESTKK